MAYDIREYSLRILFYLCQYHKALLEVVREPLLKHKAELVKMASAGDEDAKELLMKEAIVVDEVLAAHTKPFAVNYAAKDKKEPEAGKPSGAGLMNISN